MIFKSTMPDINIEFKGVYQILFNDANGISDSKPVFIDGLTGRKLTYGELKSNTKKLAAGLIDKAGFKRGDVLAIYSTNQIDYPVVLFGAIAAGGKVLFANPTCKVEEFTRKLENSRAKYIIAFPSLIKEAINAAAAANIPKSNIFLFGDEEIDEIKPYSSLISEREENPVEYSPEEANKTTAYICYSSGTTGVSKAVEITHSNIAASLAQFSYVYYDDIYPDTIFIGVLPFHHLYGTCKLIHLILLKGASVVIMQKFDLSTFCKIIQDYKVNVIPVIPSIILSLVNNNTQYDLSSLYLCLISAAPLSKELAEKFTDIFKTPIKQCYGLTEVTTVTHIATDDIVPGSIGKLVPNVECKIIDEKGEELEYNQSGELCIRGPNIMKGYLDNAKETNACIDSEGWLHTGDLASIDKSGNYYIVGRIKDMIKYMGFQVPPAELEAILTTHKPIADAAVVGVYVEQEATEYPVACVVLRQNIPKTDILKKEIKDFVSSKVAEHKKLRGIYFIDQIPRNAVGKILRNELLKDLKDLKDIKDKFKIENPFYTSDKQKCDNLIKGIR